MRSMNLKLDIGESGLHYKLCRFMPYTNVSAKSCTVDPMKTPISLLHFQYHFNCVLVVSERKLDLHMHFQILRTHFLYGAPAESSLHLLKAS
jgi:hypothetical protein